MISKLKFKDSFFLIAGPCAIESEEMAFDIARYIKAICEKLEIPFVFKGSYRKANRSRLDSFTGIGDEKALAILNKIRKELDIPVTTDIHSVEEAKLAAKHVDILQIPAFLCRQTDLIIAAAKTGKTINIKKGQFLSPDSIKFAVEKVKRNDNNCVLITERGSQFGYNNLVVDFTGIPIMQDYAPVVLDVTHSLQLTNQESGITLGKPKYIETLAKAAIASGVDGIFIETHPNPITAKSDGSNMLPLKELEVILQKLVRIKQNL
ncbi:MAG: 3-deoxy-8-phosphooctulonate synthase [Flavobacteriales bacterium]|nr:3-deoxy-8-phosphooctulonate synthase [Flavobacteriales bacterium]